MAVVHCSIRIIVSNMINKDFTSVMKTPVAPTKLQSVRKGTFESEYCESRNDFSSDNS